LLSFNANISTALRVVVIFLAGNPDNVVAESSITLIPLIGLLCSNLFFSSSDIVVSDDVVFASLTFTIRNDLCLWMLKSNGEKKATCACR
jgi:hypothetical protein